MGCGSSARLYAVNEAIRTADNSPEAQQNIATVNVTARAKDGRVPFVQACKYGRTKMVKFMFEHDKKGRIRASVGLVEDGLRANCAGDTKEDLVRFLIEEGEADVNHTSIYGDTALTLVAAKNEMTSKEVLTQRRHAAVALVESGADFGHPNGEGLTALQVACRDLNERMALLLAEKGGNIMDCQKFMRKKENAKNWVAGSVLARYAFKYPKFLSGLKRQFMMMFDANGDGEIDRGELTHFIASHVKMAFKAGLMPTQEFFDDGSLEISQIESLLESRCKDMLKGYFSMDKDHDGSYSWEELLPIVKDFYTNLWNQNRPAEADMVDDVDYEAKDHDLEEAGYGGGAAVEDYGTGTGAATEDYGPGLNTPSAAGASTYSINAAAAADLPPNWVAVDDPLSGQVYYANTVTHESSWEKPTA